MMKQFTALKIAVVFFTVFMILLSAAGAVVYRSTAESMKNQLGNKCLGIASAAATLIERDAGLYRRLVETLDTDSAYYKTLKANMEKIRFGNVDSIAFLYAEVRVSDTEMMYIVDGELEGTDTFAKPGLIEPLTETRRVAYDTQSPYIGDFVTTVWGTLLSAYAPIFDPDTGDFIGIIGADVSIEQYSEIMNTQLLVIIVSIGVLILMMLIMGSRLLVVYEQKARLDGINANLEAAVRERTEELEKQTHLAVEASKAKSAFLARMSHEIRTPMNAVIGLSEVLLQNELPGETYENVLNIKEAGTGLLSIINDILDFSKVEAGKLDIVNTDYMFGSLIHDVVNIIRFKIEETNLRFNTSIDPRLPNKLRGDMIRVRQVLLNLLGNAVKYTPAGSVDLTVSGTAREDGVILLMFEVADTGIGIRQEDMEKIFGSFSQVDSAKNQGIEGTGLGLAISQNLCRLMGGDITVRSEYGKGSVFTAVIPQEIVDGQPFKEPEKEDDSDRSGGGRRNIGFTAPGARVLAVDDSRVNLTVLKNLLEPYKMKINTGLSGEEAIGLVKENQYDIIFMDHMMPGMDGVEATAAIREWERERGVEAKIPIIALTANAILGMREMFIENGFSDYLSKPIDMAKLDKLVALWIKDELKE